MCTNQQNPRMNNPVILTRDVPYSEEPSALLSQVPLLLESADITTRAGLSSIAIVEESLRVTCNGKTVTVEPLTSSGELFAQHLTDQLADRGVEAQESTPCSQSSTYPTRSFTFEPSQATDERERLKALSSVEPLRLLQLHSGYKDPDGMLPFLGGGFAFDYLETFEGLPRVEQGSNTFPDYQFLVAEILLVIDHENRTAKLLGVGYDPEELEQKLSAVSFSASPEVPHNQPIQARADLSDADYGHAVEELKAAIQRGDIYQVVPARTFTLECEDAFSAYRRLRRQNPSPYMFYVRGLDRNNKPFELFGASPESNLTFDAAHREVRIYPVAGTRSRGMNPDGSINSELDIRNELELRTDSKEISEHVMLVDLARNDLARVAVPHTRTVAELMKVDRYSQVMHLVSRVTATLAEDFDALDAYRACMNMGTLTGAPKLRATELLRGVERRRRGSYGGAVGYFRGDGNMDNCIVIRSAYVQDGVASVQAGAGVVRDSDPQSEADETLHKAMAVLRAIADRGELEVLR